MKLEGEKLNNTSPMRLNLLKRELGDRMKIEGFLYEDKNAPKSGNEQRKL